MSDSISILLIASRLSPYSMLPETRRRFSLDVLFGLGIIFNEECFNILFFCFFISRLRRLFKNIVHSFFSLLISCIVFDYLIGIVGK